MKQEVPAEVQLILDDGQVHLRTHFMWQVRGQDNFCGNAVWHQSQFAWPVILQWNKKTTMGNMRCVTYSTHAILMTGRYQSCSTTSCKKQNSNFLCIIKAIQWYQRLRHGDLDYRRAMLQPAPPSVRPKILWLSISRTPFYIEPHTCFGARFGVV